MDQKLPWVIVALVIVVLALFLLDSIRTPVEFIPNCGDTKCESGETSEGCPADCAEDDGGTICQYSTECKSGVCNFIKQDFGACGAVDCEEGELAIARDGQIKFECREGEWIKVDGKETCKDNPYCELNLPCMGPNEIRVLRADQYSEECVESMAQMILPTVCISCGDDVCDEDESGCNCPEDCEEETITVDYSCRVDSDCVSTCGEGCVNEDWAEGYDDTCVNVRAWDCTCVEGTCYTDGQPPKEDKTVEERYNGMVDTCFEDGEDFFLAIENCIEISPIYTEYKKWCESINGYFGQQGMYPVPSCNPRASDAGKECTDSSQCEGDCLSEDETIRDNAVGECSSLVYVFGCIAPVNDGKVEYVICID